MADSGRGDPVGDPEWAAGLLRPELVVADPPVVPSEDEYVTALAEAATYRQLFLETLAMLSEESQRARGASERLRQTMGIEAPHGPESE